MKFIIITFTTLLISYLFVLNNQFIGDDDIRILRNKELSSFWLSLTGDLGDRPLLMLLTWLQYTLFGLKPVFFRISNLILHTFAAFQLYKLILDFNVNNKFEYKKVFAYFAAFLFAVHPLHNQTMNIAIQSSIPLGACLGILSFRYFLKYLENNKANFLLYSNFALTLAILAKPNVIFFPIVFFITWLTLYRKHKNSFYFFLTYLSVFLIPIFFYFFLNKNIQQEAISPISYFLTQTEVLFTYYRLILAPINLKYLYDFYPPLNIFFNKNWIFLIIHILIFTFLYRNFSNKLQRLFLIGFFISFLPESSFFPINHFAFEHRTYFPLVFIFLFIAQICIDRKAEFSKIKKIVLIIIPFYLILNQARNFQIKPMHNWLLHSIENSVTHHTFNTSFTSMLLESKLYTFELVPIIEKYKKLYSDIPEYKILILAHDYQMEPDFNKITSLAKYVLMDLNLENRLWINKFLIETITSDQYSHQKVKNTIIIESMLANQMRVFFENEKSILKYKYYIDYYQGISNRILNDVENYKNEINNIELLRIKSILFHYYDFEFYGLQEQVKEEFRRDQNSTILKRLLDLTQSRLK